MGALDGLFVVAIEQAVAAPMCTVRLADAGARVVKIERSGGETARGYDSAVAGTSAYFAWLNRGKESAELDLKDPHDLDLLYAMLRCADVLVQNLAPGALDRMGLSAKALATANPRLISVSIVGYGQDTPYAQMKAYDMLVQAEAGLCAVTGTPEVPSKVGVSIADILTGMNAHAAVLEALITRSITGKGRHIEVSMFDGLADCMAVPLLHFEHMGKETGRFGLSHATIYPYRPFACADGTVIVAVQTNDEFARLCHDALERPDLATRKEFANNADRVANRNALDAEMEPIFAAITVNRALDLLKGAGIAFGRYSDVSDLSAHPALSRVDAPLPGNNVAALPRPAGRDDSFTAGPVPALGEHTGAIRHEFGKG
ncbi:MAG: CaiB/BaiF CoA-transferase family protein [Pseudomonadota bacterium]